MAKSKVPSKIKVEFPKDAKIADAPTRSFQDVQNEFGALCARAGHLQYQIYTFKKDLDLINSQIRDLNLEAAAIKVKTDAASVQAKKEAAQKETE